MFIDNHYTCFGILLVSLLPWYSDILSLCQTLRTHILTHVFIHIYVYHYYVADPVWRTKSHIVQ